MNPSIPRTAARCRSLFLPVLLLLLPVMVIASQGFGITYDEPLHARNGLTTYGFLLEGQRGLVYDETDMLPLYGSLFDFTAEVAHRALPAMDLYDVRHAVNSLYGWVGILFTGLLARRLFGDAAGLLAVLFLALSPRWFAHSMNNPKDLPFASLFMAGLYCISRLRPAFPHLTPGLTVATLLSVAMAINVRASGILLLCYFVGWLALLFSVDSSRDRGRATTRRALAALPLLALFCLAALLLGTVLWPWALENPLVRPFQALAQMSRFPWSGTILYQGAVVRAEDLPWHYIPVWIGITTPMAVLLGLAAALLLLPARWWTGRTGAALLLAAALLPYLYVLARRAVVYDEYRHLLFVYPCLVAVSAGAWSAILDRLAGRKLLLAASASLLILLLADPIRFHLANYPNQAVYFNGLAGSTQGALKRFEMDYWGGSVSQAVDWLAAEADKRGEEIPFSAGYASHLAKLRAERHSRLRYVTERERTRYHIDLLHHSPAVIDRLLREPNIVHAVVADGVPICIVRDFGPPSIDR